MTPSDVDLMAVGGQLLRGEALDGPEHREPDAAREGQDVHAG